MLTCLQMVLIPWLEAWKSQEHLDDVTDKLKPRLARPIPNHSNGSDTCRAPMATANAVPQLWQPNSGLLMTNDVSGVNLEEAVRIALSKNDSYVMSTAGGLVSLFNMMTFEALCKEGQGILVEPITNIVDSKGKEENPPAIIKQLLQWFLQIFA
ncbi:topless-related 3-like [Olea europaea subsp. europaea]|uniref:Topless-related 3-like n=1 Tax=Olea europaea subsp. europaea TaxID=158383 RepID=A0A8S0QZ60_OLEEU|nr:topless-related 3-like [Olea europaea subsp. europaea]